MPDLRERFHELDRLDAPDLWSDARERHPRGTVPGGRAGRPLAAVLALAVAAAGFAVLMWTFSSAPRGRTPVGADGGGSPTDTASPTVDNALYLPPFLEGGPEWDTRASGLLPAGDAGVVWASTTPLKDWPRPGQPAIPVDTISTMPPDAVIVTAEATPWAFDPSLGPFPYGDVNLDLAAATPRGPKAEEPPGDYAVLEVDVPSVLVRVYFGASSPASDIVAAAQRELDTLELPPVCPSPTKGPYGASMNATSGPAGANVTVSGEVPFQTEDGSYVRSPRTLVAWWYAAPRDWATLASVSAASPSPAIPGSDAIKLGQDDAQSCEFSISFTVPDVPPGTYPIVVIQEGGGGAAKEASLSFTVT
jgi:hypothetical protein